MGKKQRGKPKEPNKVERQLDSSNDLLYRALQRIEELEAKNTELRLQLVAARAGRDVTFVKSLTIL